MLSFSIKMILIVFLLGSCVCETDYFSKENTLSFELRRQKTPTEQFANKGHHFGAKIMNKISARDNDSIALYRFLDDEFYGEIVIGHPGQKFFVNFDTSWSYSWVMSSKCSDVRTIGCYFHNKYDHSKSSEYKKDGKPFSQDLGKYNLTGFFSYDNISIAHSNATAQSFIEITHVPYDFIINKADGVMGLGLKTGDYNPFFYTLFNQKKIKNPIFSIYLNRDRQSKRGGNVMLGFIDSKHIHKTKINNVVVPDNFTYLPVDANLAYWQFNMDKVVVNDKNNGNLIVCEKGCKAIVDTSTSSIIGPQKDIDQINDIIKASPFFLNRYTVDCDTVNKLPKIDFMLSGNNFTLGGEDYTIKMAYHSITLCLSAFVPAYTPEEQDRWVVGGAFLAQFYTVYNIQEKTIGFVRSH